MEKLTKLAKVVATLAGNPGLLGRVLIDPYDGEIQERMAREYRLGKGLPTIDLLDLVPSFDETVDPYCFMNGSSRTIDLAFLKGLLRTLPRRRYLEIGTLRGESIANLAPIAEECVSVSLSDEELLARGATANDFKNNGMFLGGIANLKRIGHDSTTLDFSTLGQFDMVFIDGDHAYEGVRQDTRNAFRILRDENSVIVWHDYGFEYEATRWPVMAGILDGAPEEERGRIYHVSNTLCAIYTRKQLPSEMVEHPAVPTKLFSVRISARKL